MKEKTLWIFTLLLIVLLSACDLVEQFKEMSAKADETSAAIEKQVGSKPTVGVAYENGALAQVDVNFTNSPSLGIIELEKITHADVKEAFKLNPNSQFKINLTFNKEGVERKFETHNSSKTTWEVKNDAKPMPAKLN